MERTCIVTHEKSTKNNFIRIARIKNKYNSEISVKIDATGKLGGRGVYLKPDLKIFDIAVKKNIFKYQFKLEKSLTTEQIAVLRDNFIKTIKQYVA